MELKQEKQRYSDYLRDIHVFCAQNGLRAMFTTALWCAESEDERHCMTIENERTGKKIILKADFNAKGSCGAPELQIGLYSDSLLSAPLFFNNSRVLMTSQRGQETFPQRFHGIMVGMIDKGTIMKSPLCSLVEREKREAHARERVNAQRPTDKLVIG